jgi:rare lipoprotein A (peptidoglycan hydrolase)
MKKRSCWYFVHTLVAAIVVASSVGASPAHVHAETETCEASWYGPGFQGNPMANTKPFDMNDVTVVAHKEHPFGTVLKITNLENGRQLFAVVQDRGPFIPGRCVDLSRAGARALEFYCGANCGTTPVRVEVCDEVCQRDAPFFVRRVASTS